MQTKPSLLTRDDTFLGVCEGLGQDFGFNPDYLRIVFGIAVLWSPVNVLALYLLLGVGVAVARWLFPANAEKPAVAASAEVAPLRAENDAAAPVLAAAA